MSNYKVCPFREDLSCYDCEFHVEGNNKKFVGCVFRVISANLMEINIKLRMMLEIIINANS